jgi:hypothetical protein
MISTVPNAAVLFNEKYPGTILSSVEIKRLIGEGKIPAVKLGGYWIVDTDDPTIDAIAQILKPRPKPKMPKSISKTTAHRSEIKILFDEFLSEFNETKESALEYLFSKREEDIFVSLILKGEQQTLEQLGERWETSRERIRQILLKCEEKLVEEFTCRIQARKKVALLKEDAINKAISDVAESKRVFKHPDDAQIAELPLPCRARHSLCHAGLQTVGEVRSLQDEELLHIRNLGNGTLNEIKQVVYEEEPRE